MKKNTSKYVVNKLFKLFLGVIGITLICYTMTFLLEEIMGITSFENSVALTVIFAKILLFISSPFIISIGIGKLLNSTRKLTHEDQRTKQRQEKEKAQQYHEKNVKLYYLDTREIFKNAMKSRNLNRQQILNFKSKLNRCLSIHGKLKDYKDFYFKNDAYEIYTKLKNTYLIESDFEELQEYLNSIINQQKRDIV